VTAITEAPGSLDWVRFSDEEDEPCGAVRRRCPAQAVAVAYFQARCRCAPGRQPLCAAHRDATVASSRKWHGFFTCVRCGAWIRLLRIEPIR
jgi:hypothetical protein